jgi:hypothetical protein
MSRITNDSIRIHWAPERNHLYDGCQYFDRESGRGLACQTLTSSIHSDGTFFGCGMPHLTRLADIQRRGGAAWRKE